MRSPHDIDNEEPLFQFDPFDEQSMTASSSTGPCTFSTVTLPKPMPSPDLSGESEMPTPSESVGKGKARSTMPMPIRDSITTHDLFDVPPPSSNATPSFGDFHGSSIAISPISSGSPSSFEDRFRHCSLSIDSMEGMESPEGDFPFVMTPSSIKGKERESVPMLPPLTFSIMQLDYAQIISPSAGPSSCGALFSPPLPTVNLPLGRPSSTRENSVDRLPRFPSPNSISSTDHSPPVSLTRCRSLSSISQDFSPTPNNVSTMVSSQVTFGPSRSPSNISRQLLLDKKDNIDSHFLDSINRSPGPSAVRPDLISVGADSRAYLPAWYTVAKPLALSPQIATHTATSAHAIGTLKGKTRSKSSPYPISALDYVPIASSDIFQPIPIVVVNYFDRFLPRELRLRILAALIELHEQDLIRSIADGRLTMAKATSSKGRWVGRDKGIRELFKLSRVSKAWQALVFDGELWTDLDFRSFPGLPPSILTRLVKVAGSFVRSLNLSGHVQLLPDAMSDITNNLCLTMSTSSTFTQLTRVNLQGCTYLTTRSIHNLLVLSKNLQVLCLKGLGSATNTTCEIIAKHLHNLTSLNLSRCPNVDGYGVSALVAPAVHRKGHMPMKELRLSGLKYMTDSVMQALGRAMPYLEVLDLSYARQLHNSALEAFVACDSLMVDPYAPHTVIVSARDLGREANESGKYRRRVTKLHHLVLSSCYLLTDMACSNLAHSLPDLEFLELAGIGAELKDEGIARLLGTTPNIRRLDLEDAIQITDFLISELTPPVPPSAPASGAGAGTSIPKQAGHALEYLNISFASNVSEDALVYLMRNCPRLTVLEADNTRLGADTLREFVKLSRRRKIANAKIVAIDCRGITEGVIKELSPQTRPRLGWRAYDARKLMYLDARDDNEEELRLGQDECDEARVVLKSFYSWQTVNAVQAAKERRRKFVSRRSASDAATDAGGERDAPAAARSARWWSPSGRRAAANAIGRGRNSPPMLPDLNNEGCRAM